MYLLYHCVFQAMFRFFHMFHEPLEGKLMAKERISNIFKSSVVLTIKHYLLGTVFCV